MAITPDSVEIVKKLVESICPIVEVNEVILNVDGTYTLTACNTFYATEKMTVTIDAVDYKITSVDQNVSITVKKLLDGNPDPIPGPFKLYSPFYFHGTVRSTGNELDNTKWQQKYPLIYLYETYSETHYVDQTSMIGYEGSLRIFFMQQVKSSSYSNTEHREKVIRPMKAMVDSFIEAVIKSPIINKLTTNYRLIAWTNFGVFETNKGETKKLFSDDISGYELEITLPVKASYLDKIECEINNC